MQPCGATWNQKRQNILFRKTHSGKRNSIVDLEMPCNTAFCRCFSAVTNLRILFSLYGHYTPFRGLCLPCLRLIPHLQTTKGATVIAENKA